MNIVVTIGLVLLLAFTIYIALGVFLLWRLPTVEVEELWLDPKDLFPPLASDEEIKDTREALEKEPTNPELHKKLMLGLISRLDTEKNNYPELAKEIFPEIVWFIKNLPLQIPQGFSIIRAISDYITQEQIDILRIEWDIVIKNNNFKANYIKAASEFFAGIVLRFGVEYNDLLLKKYPFLPDALSEQASFLNTRSYNRTDGCYNRAQSLEKHMEVLNLPWRSVDNYHLMDFIDRYRFFFSFKMLWYPIFILYAYAFCPPKDHIYLLGTIGNLALDLKNSDAVHDTLNRISQALPEAEENTPYLPFLSGAYNFLGRLAIKYDDLETLKIYLKKKTHNEVTSQFSFSFHDKELIKDLYFSKYSYLLRGYLESRKRNDDEDLESNEIPVEIEKIIDGTSTLYPWNERTDPYT